MNVAQAIQSLFPDIDPARHILEASPSPMPKGAFFVITDLVEGEGREYYRRASGHKPQERHLTVLVTMYGQEGWKLANLRPTFQRLKRFLPDLITEHPDLPPLAGVSRGAAIPPTPDSVSRRPLASVRLHLKYLE